jgi:hypothetical protein
VRVEVELAFPPDRAREADVLGERGRTRGTLVLRTA